ncbi:Carboxymethylenebutenolidase homolog [Coccomyxa sp. Obi]|nr:Carboxymethylenebutenolidase homolog [Coccomyxa sp. Obi]
MAEFKQCCDPGTDWQGEPTGMVGTITTLDAYLAEPKDAPKAAILLIHDIHGWEKNNIRLYADKLAAEGFAAVVPDFFRGQAPKPGFSRTPGFLEHFPQDRVVGECKDILKELRSRYNVEKVGAEGFCWGGCYTVLLLGSGDIDAGVVAHGSRIKLEDVEAIQKPILFLFSANDRQIPDELREKIQGVLKTKPFPAEGVYYPNQAHGWSLRGDDQDEKVAVDARDAYARALAWFQKRL